MKFITMLGLFRRFSEFSSAFILFSPHSFTVNVASSSNAEAAFSHQQAMPTSPAQRKYPNPTLHSKQAGAKETGNSV